MNGVRRLTWLLMGLLLSVAFYSFRPQAERVYVHANQPFPDIVAPEGIFADVFDATRPATLRIEARSPLVQGRPIGVGTGFFISADGFVLTANHVVDTSGTTRLPAEVRRSIRYIGISPDNTEYELEVVGFDAYQDLSLLRTVVSEDVPYLPLAAEPLRTGTDIIAIGNSGNDFLEGRAGRISRLDVASPQVRFAGGTIELTAALSPGDSGGPVINEQGEAIAVVSFISYRPDQLESGNEANIPNYLRDIVSPKPSFASYAIPIPNNSDIIMALMQGERRDVPVIGLTLPGGGYFADEFPVDLGPRSGALVGEVQPGGPAEQAGIQSYDLDRQTGLPTSADIIIAVNDEAITNNRDLLEVLYAKRVGEEVVVSVQRGADLFKLRLVLGAKQDVFR